VSRQDTAERLLVGLTDALNALSEAGIPAKLKHGAVYTDAGYVLPIGEGRWVARTLLYTELMPVGEFDDEE
jgi:hypothetical protein